MNYTLLYTVYDFEKVVISVKLSVIHSENCDDPKSCANLSDSVTGKNKKCNKRDFQDYQIYASFYSGENSFMFQNSRIMPTLC